MMKTLHTKKEMDEAIASSKPSIIIWSVNWCPDCTYLKPYLPKIEADNPDFTFYMMDRDENIDLAVEEGIMGIPSLAAYCDGKKIGDFVSSLRKSPEEIQAFLDKMKKETA